MSDPEPIDELLAEAAVLHELDAARAEAWASGLLADWDDHASLLASLERCAGAQAVTARAIAVALTPMLPAARAVADGLGARGAALPAFAEDVGTAHASAAWTIRDPHGSGTSVVVEYEHASGTRHDMLVELDGDVAVDLLVGPPGVVDTARGEGAGRFEIEEMPPAAALARIRTGLELVHGGATVPLTDAFLLNHALVASRVGLVVALPAVADGDTRSPRADDPEGDELARATLAAALAGRRPGPPDPAAVAAAAAAFRRAVDAGDPDACAVYAEVEAEPGWSDETLLLRVAGAYVAPGPRLGLSPAAADAVDALEWADWLGAVLPLVRTGAGASASPEDLVRNVNRCPEVTTTIPKRDAPAVASAFAVALPAWRLAGALGEGDALTPLGVWLLPHALAGAWGAPSGSL